MTKKQIEENDFKAYIASSGSSSSGSDDEAIAGPSTSTSKSIAKESRASRRDKLRALLTTGADNDELPEGWGGVHVPKGDMEVTFTAGLSTNSAAANNDEDNETTLERYQRRQKEKKAARKAAKEMRAAKNGPTTKADDGPNNDDATDRHRPANVKEDDFFGDDSDDRAATSNQKRSGKDKANGTSKTRTERSPSPATAAQPSTAEELVLLLAPDTANGSGPKHFDMKEVLRAEKDAKRKGKNKKGKKRAGDDMDAGEKEDGSGFTLDVADSRFAALHEEPEFAIDPSNPQ